MISVPFQGKSFNITICFYSVATGKHGLGIQNEAGQRLIEFCQENALVIANTQALTSTHFAPGTKGAKFKKPLNTGEFIFKIK